MPAYLQDYVRFGFITGMRKGEIISMRWANVDRAAGVVRLVDDDAKTGEGRTLNRPGFPGDRFS